MASTGQRAFAQKLSKQGAAEVRRQVSSTIFIAPEPTNTSAKSTTHSHSSTGSTFITHHTQQTTGTLANDGIEPPDFEDFVIQNQCLIERDPFKDLLLYPEDDIDVHTVPKTSRTVTPVVPESSDLDPIVKDCVQRYTSDYTVVTRRYQRYSSSFHSKEKLADRDGIIHQEYEIDDMDEMPPEQEKQESNKRQSLHLNETPRGSWASSIFDLKQSQADALLPNLFQRMSYDDVDHNNENQRQQNRQDNIFSLFPPQEEEECIERRAPMETPKEHFGHRIHVKCLQLSLEMEVEPIFVTLALYDARERKKISETFHFDMNSDHLKRMIHMHVPHQDISTLSRGCNFSITYPTNDVFLVVKLEKVLQQGDISECAEPYMKEDKSAKEEKYRTQATQFCDRLGKYRMPFAWTAIYLMNIVGGQSNSLEREASVEKSIDHESPSSRAASLDRRSGVGGQFSGFRKQSKDDLLAGRRGSIDRGRAGYEKRRSWSPESYGASLDNFRPVTLTVSSFFKQESDKLSDDDLYKFLADLKRPSSVLKRVKCIPATLKLDVSPCPEEPRYNLTPELWKVEPYPDDKGRPTKEVTEFPAKEVFIPYSTYKNLLFVYPKYLNFTNRQGSARNLAVKIQYMVGEDEVHAIPVIFGKSSCPELTREAYTAVTYHNKSPDFYEEIKIRLPGRLNEQHHLMFTVYHISCQVKKNEPTPVEIPVGYTWLPLMKEGRLQTGEFSLPVSVEKPPPRFSMLHPDIKLPNMKWVDNQKCVFQVNVKAVSSVHTQDEHVDRFLHLINAAQEQKIPPRMTEVHFENELKRSIMDVVKAKGENLIHFLPLILDKLIMLMARPPVIGGNILNTGQSSFEAIAQIVQQCSELLEDKNDANGRNSILVAYIQYCSKIPSPASSQNSPQGLGSPTMHSQGGYNTLGRPSSLPITKQSYMRSTSNPDLAGQTPTSPDAEVFSFNAGRFERGGSVKMDDIGTQGFSKMRGKKLVHEELALQWVVSSGSMRETALANSWFFFELIVKSMAEHLGQADRLTAPRQMRFPDHFLDDISSLVNTLIRDIVERYIRDPPLIKSLNTSLAFFLHDLMCLMDRGTIFTYIHTYCRTIAGKMSQLSDSTSLILLRLDFIRIICSHEHYFPLNLPFATPLTPSGTSSPTPSSGSAISHHSFASNTSTSTLTDKGVYLELTPEFRQQHFLVGLVLSDLSAAFDTFNPSIHQRAVNVVRNLLYNHDLDVRYTNPEVKGRLAAMYLPLVGIVMGALPQMYDPNTEGRNRESSNFDEEGDKISKKLALAIAGASFCASGEAPYDPNEPSTKVRKCPLNMETTRNLLICFLWVLKNAEHSLLKQWWGDLPMVKLNKLLEVVYFCVSNFEYKAKWAIINFDLLTQLRLLRPNLSSSEETLEDWGSGSNGGDSPPHSQRPKSHTLPKSQSLHEQLWEGIQRKSQDFIRGTGTLLNRSFSRDDPTGQVQGKKMLAQYSQQTLKRSTDMKSRLEEAILGTGNARTEMMMRRRGTAGSLSGDRTPPVLAPESGSMRLRWRKDQVQWRHSLEIQDSMKPRDVESDAHVEGSLAAEVSMISLDTLELIMQIAQLSDEMQPLLSSGLRVLLHMLGLNQSMLVLQNLFSTQRALVTKFLDLLFEEETEQCADLCLRLLRHCSSCISNTRSQASASLYLLMRHNFELGNNFARVKMQVTMSLSSLVGQNQNFNEEYLRKSLKTILTYAEFDHDLQETSFPEQVRDLVFNLHMILSDTVKMKEYQNDPEMLLDLMYRIAKGYQTSPDLRLTWLQNMAQKHSERGNHAEAAQCLVHAAGLVAEYLNMLEDKPYLPVGCVAFQKITWNVLEESAISDDVVSPDEEGICSGKYFTENGLVGLLEQTASSFTMAGMYEAVNEVYKILLPIHEASRDYKKLAHIHQKLQESFNNVIRMEGKRIFGTYFRVGFYGSLFGDLDGEEFIYKEPAITKLPEISHRLESFYGDRFGYDVVSTVKDSNTVEKEKLDPAKAYIQITYVEPYFDMYEYRDRITYFDKNYNIKRFMYATPFTLDGRAHGELHEQYKRKTILTTTHTFPYVKTRMTVIERQQIILSPVEVAIEDVQKKTRELALALCQEPPDLKILQMVLQGCIGTTVNQGPLEVALVFLADVAGGTQPPSKHHNKLRLCFKDFLKKCSDSLQRNKALIASEQKEYQRELERNYHNFKEKLQPMICSNIVSLNKRSRHKNKEAKERLKRQEVNTSQC
ncbi:dedicator of cytokinesis protein 7-like isoform X1 [Haliotis rufescens]|uniref:dedicator of cytokinesis protein 7-like isoform X1 n=1 Tax=Haliotis rufescens TaxID=6454 RepID=UPI00201FA40A|nr:dedicator of cytokinesis protein 7-like isoform X1 [Haliotis rufescens]